jgi:hypothetical protein
MGASPASYQQIYGADSITEGIKKTYNSQSGTDIMATIDGILIGNLNGISFSTTREKAPIDQPD